MRSVAVLLVILGHTALYTHRSRLFGYPSWFVGILGVCIFFVHTTLVLMWSLERDPDTLRFYLRRIFRLWPLWLVVLGLYLSLHIPTSPSFAPAFGFFRPDWKQLLSNIFLAFNLHYGPGIVGADWSLPIEMQMYILLPFLFFYIRSNRKLWPLILVELLVAVTSISFEPPISSDLLFCAGFFLPGAIAYVGYNRFRERWPGWMFPVWLLLLVFVTNTYAASRHPSFRSGWPFCLALGLSLPFFRQIQSPLARRISHLIARYSYGLYLLHIPALGVSLYYLAGRSWLLQTAAFFLTLAGSTLLLYHLVEAPMIRLGSRFAKRLTGTDRLPPSALGVSLDPAP